MRHIFIWLWGVERVVYLCCDGVAHRMHAGAVVTGGNSMIHLDDIFLHTVRVESIFFLLARAGKQTTRTTQKNGDLLNDAISLYNEVALVALEYNDNMKWRGETECFGYSWWDI